MIVGQIKKKATVWVNHEAHPLEKELAGLRAQLEALPPDLSKAGRRIVIGEKITKCKQELLRIGLYVYADEHKAIKFKERREADNS